MPLYTSLPSSPTPPEKRLYAPLTPSPLNPNVYLNHLQRQQKTKRATKNSTSKIAQRYAALVHDSPTQRLLRHKAALAWRSETLRHHIRSLPQPQGSESWPLVTRLSSPTGSALFDAANHITGGSEKESESGSGWAPDLTLTIPEPDADGDEDGGSEGWSEGDIGLLVADKRAATAVETSINTNTSAGIDAGAIANARIPGQTQTQPQPQSQNYPLSPNHHPMTNHPHSDALFLVSAPNHHDHERQPLQQIGTGAVHTHLTRRKAGGGGSGGITARRVFVVVALFLGLGLVHGLVSAFWSSGGGGGGRPQAVR